jgi:hypothetical protein
MLLYITLTFIVRPHQAWCSHLKWAWAEHTQAGALRPFKFSVHSRTSLEFYPHLLAPHYIMIFFCQIHALATLSTYAPHK